MNTNTKISTMQQLFDRVASHLLTQGRKSIIGYAGCGCAYHGPDNTKCSVGCLIDDTNYSPGLEGAAVGSKIVLDAVSMSIGMDINKTDAAAHLLVALQVIHDHDCIINWPVRLREVAWIYQLNSKIIDELEESK